MVRRPSTTSVTTLLVLTAACGELRAAPDLAVSSQPVSESDLSLSRRIPIKGSEIELRARVRNGFGAAAAVLRIFGDRRRSPDAQTPIAGEQAVSRG